MFDDIRQFHEKFDLPPCNDDCPIDLLQFRSAFMQEELDEFINAMHRDNKADMFDALLDIVYVAMGTAYLLGFPWDEGWKAVQAANMRKVRARSAADSKRGTAYDVVKPEGWTAPDIESLLGDD